jgi:uncharacterized protein YecE (DUF72 family)
MDSLFQQPGGFPRERLAAALSLLARESVFLGTSSWKYDGWMGQIYTRSRYLTRGRFSQKLFESTCLREYAETFPIVCGDFSFYQFPSDDYWARLFAQAPSRELFAFKVPEQITSKVFPKHARYGARAGLGNPSFLDADLFSAAFARPLVTYRRQTAVLIFEFGAFSRQSFSGVGEFVDALDPFLAALPRLFRYAVEIRNPEYLGPDYFACLRRHNAAHVYNAWSRMPELKDQMALADSHTANFVVCRALLRRGRAYEDAVATLAPYSEIKDPNPDARRALRDLIRRSREERQAAFIFVNNRLEGNAPGTILAVVED